MNTRASLLTGGGELGVDVTAIEREFASLWRQAAGGEEVEGAVTRACLANLLAWCEDDAQLAACNQAFATLVLSVPARVLILRVGGEGARPFESWISANCIVAPGGGKLVCSEEVTLAARRDGVQHLGSVVRALLVPNVPTMALLPGLPRESPAALASLVPLCDRVIIDSGALPHPRSWAELDAGGALAGPVVDLAWTGMQTMRSALASVFDHAEPRAALRRVERVTLKVPQARAASRLLLVGWLADRLGWGLPSRGPGGEVLFRAQGRDVVVEVERLAPAEPEPDMVLELVCDTTRFSMRRGSVPFVEMGSPRGGRRMALDPSSWGERLARGMGPSAVDPLYAPAARVARALATMVDTAG